MDGVDAERRTRNLHTMTNTSKRPRDANQLAKLMIDIATGETDQALPPSTKDPKAVSRGQKGGQKGGPARASRMTPEERSQAALKAVRARWDRRSSSS